VLSLHDGDFQSEKTSYVMKVTRKSLITKIVHTRDLPITTEQMAAYQGGALLQDAFPDLSPPEREFILSGITPDEWKRHVLGADDESEEDRP
jgi:hypothetical protein